MTEQIPTPTPEQVQQWLNHLTGDAWRRTHTTDDFILAARAAEWGANRELEECINWIRERPCTWTVEQLRAARRPQPKSLAEEALKAIEEEQADVALVNYKVIRAALERLQELEGQGND